MSAEEMLQSLPWAKFFATGPEDLLNKRHKHFCMICWVKVSMRAGEIFEIEPHYNSPSHLRQGQRYREKYCPDAVSRKDARGLHVHRSVAEREREI